MKPRIFFLFLGALCCGALTVSGQDGENADELTRRITELTAELRERAAAASRAADTKPNVVRMYGVADLTARALDESAASTNLQPSNWAPPEPIMHEGRAVEIDWLVELIRSTVYPDAWDREGASIEIKNNKLLVTTTPAVHDGLVRLLARLRGYVAAQVVVEITAVAVEPDEAERLRGKVVLTAEEAARLKGRSSLGRLQLTALDAQQVVQRIGAKREYVRGYDVKVAQKAVAAQPLTASYFDGMTAQVRTVLDRAAGGAVLHMQLERTAHETIRRVNAGVGVVELPEIGLTRLWTSFWAPLDRTVVAGVVAGRHGSCVFLATVRRVKPGG